MSWLDHQEKLQQAKGTSSEISKNNFIKIHMPGAPEGVYVILGKNQIQRKYEDEVGARLLIVVDECAELLQPTNVKTEAGKQEDQLKQKIVGIIQSITQLGRSAGVHMILCTQRNDKTLINGIIQNNSLALDTKVKVRRQISAKN